VRKKKSETIMFNGAMTSLAEVVDLARQHVGDAHTIEDLKFKLEATREQLKKTGESLQETMVVLAAKAAGERERLPAQRDSVTYHFAIYATEGTCKGYLTTGFYPDGRVGEIFFKLGKMGETVTGACDSWAIGVSMLLQLGVPLEVLINKFRGTTFEPKGRTDTPGIRTCTSPIDFAMKYLERRFVKKLPLVDETPEETK
jgi:hypothetical protein